MKRSRPDRHRFSRWTQINDRPRHKLGFSHFHVNTEWISLRHFSMTKSAVGLDDPLNQMQFSDQERHKSTVCWSVSVSWGVLCIEYLAITTAALSSNIHHSRALGNRQRIVHESSLDANFTKPIQLWYPNANYSSFFQNGKIIDSYQLFGICSLESIGPESFLYFDSNTSPTSLMYDWWMRVADKSLPGETSAWSLN